MNQDDKLGHQKITVAPVPSRGESPNKDGGADPWVIEPLEEVITRLNFALSGILLYPVGHPVIEDTAGKIYEILHPLLDIYPLIILKFRLEEVSYNNELLLESSFLARQLSGLFQERQIGSLTFARGLTLEELRSLIYTFRQGVGAGKTKLAELEQLLVQKNVIHIQLGGLQTESKQQQGSRLDMAKTILTSGKKILESVALGAVNQRVVDVNQVRPVVQDIIDNLTEDNSALLAVTSLKSYDTYLFSHSMNVCILSLSLAMYLDLEPVRLMELGVGALLHDIGKIFIPQEIIHKPGKLNDAEWNIIKRHPVDGAKMLLRSKYASELPILIVYAHHWQNEGTKGYPETRRKIKQTPYVSIVTICDCYDAMTTNRPYNRIHLPSSAISIMEKLGSVSFDPLLFHFFKKMLGPYPIGTLVRLDTNEVGLVLRTNQDEMERPHIKLILDVNSMPVKGVELWDLSEKNDSDNTYRHTILEVIDPTTVSFKIEDYI